MRNAVKKLEPRALRQARWLLRWKLQPARRWPGFGVPLNAQQARIRTVLELLARFEPDVVLETGTFLGDTTRFFSALGHRVVTIEVSPVFYAWSKLRLRRSDVELVLGESTTKLAAVSEQHGGRMFAYLDAHWEKLLPLKQEVALLMQRPDVLVAIDDFKVPSDPGYAFDVYDGQALELDMLELPADVMTGFPAIPSSRESGARRGVVYLARGTHASAALTAVRKQGLVR